MAAGRKQVTFDLDTKSLKKYYPSDNWNNAYEKIKPRGDVYKGV